MEGNSNDGGASAATVNDHASSVEGSQDVKRKMTKLLVEAQATDLSLLGERKIEKTSGNPESLREVLVKKKHVGKQGADLSILDKDSDECTRKEGMKKEELQSGCKSDVDKSNEENEEERKTEREDASYVQKDPAHFEKEEDTTCKTRDEQTDEHQQGKASRRTRMIKRLRRKVREMFSGRRQDKVKRSKTREFVITIFPFFH